MSATPKRMVPFMIRSPPGCDYTTLAHGGEMRRGGGLAIGSVVRAAVLSGRVKHTPHHRRESATAPRPRAHLGHLRAATLAADVFAVARAGGLLRGTA